MPAGRPALDTNAEAFGSAVRLRVATPADELEIFAGSLEDDAPSPKPAPVRRAEEQLLAAIKARDAAHALTLASVLVYMDPDHATARLIKDQCAKQMEGTRTRAFPRPSAIPRQKMPWSELRHRTLSRAEAYLLWCVDGRSTVEEIVDASAMAPLTAFETLDALIREGIVDLG